MQARLTKPGLLVYVMSAGAGCRAVIVRRQTAKRRSAARRQALGGPLMALVCPAAKVTCVS
ncbi:hypothetical protein DW219_05675 [Desulfovibrio sp. AM18-2]|nr:hypothetical protein DW219_05675 [Desulfovibrio sp. AM18-2]